MEWYNEVTQKRTIAIIGGGFSGLSVVLHLVDGIRAGLCKTQLEIVIVEKDQLLGVGFGTKDPCHPLNVRTINMGAFAEHPDHFYQWLLENKNLWKSQDAFFSNLNIAPFAFVPRKLYGIYLNDLFLQADETAKKNGSQIKIVKGEAVSLQEVNGNRFRVNLRNGETLDSDYVVLAASVSPIKSLGFENDLLLQNRRYVRNIWAFFGENKAALPLDQHDTVCILGSGLTAIDTILSLHNRKYPGKIIIVSRSGKFPETHVAEASRMINLEFKHYPKSCRELLREMRRLSKQYIKNGNWRDFADSLRPHITKLWQHLDVKSKKQFLRHLFSFWNHHRHRMSPGSKAVVDKMMEEGRLLIVRGKVLDVVAEKEKLNVKFLSTDTNANQTVSARYVFNCTGPDYLIKNRNDILFDQLLKQGFIEPDELGLGLKTKEHVQLEGKNGGKMYAIGSLLFGERLETIAVPELRNQANSIAKSILQKG